jgi:CheY-like chemotaxis protein
MVDDRIENLVALDAILSSLNQILVPVTSGEQALQALRTGEFAVILLDIVMPGMDGFETAAQIKRQADTRDVPIIFLTAGIGEPEQAFRGYAAGAVDYLAKPFDPWVLKSKVSVFVDLYLKGAKRRDQAEPSGQRPALDQLAGRLADVEETVAMLRELPAVSKDAEVEELTARLAGRVRLLRDAVGGLDIGRGVDGGRALGDDSGVDDASGVDGGRALSDASGVDTGSGVDQGLG